MPGQPTCWLNKSDDTGERSEPLEPIGVPVTTVNFNYGKRRLVVYRDGKAYHLYLEIERTDKWEPARCLVAGEPSNPLEPNL